MDYGFNLRIGVGAFLNFNCTVLDSCLVSIGPRTLVGPNVSFYSGTHPLDPEVRNGINGPEMGKEIHIGEDCWIGGQVVILSGVKIGRGCTIGAGSVVTRVRLVLLICRRMSSGSPQLERQSSFWLIPIRACLVFMSWRAIRQKFFEESKLVSTPSNEVKRLMAMRPKAPKSRWPTLHAPSREHLRRINGA